jgi:ribosomal protein S16
MWLVCAGCGVSSAQQAKKAGMANPAQTQSDNGPSLQETLSFLTNAFRNEAIADKQQTCAGNNGSSFPMGWRSAMTVESASYPVLSIVRKDTTTDRQGNPVEHIFGYSLDLSKVDPQQIRVGKQESTDQWVNNTVFCTPHITTFFVHLEGTDKEQIYKLNSGGGAVTDASNFDIGFASEDVANRVSKAITRAVVLAGGKPSAF